jgi:hypothetical protein
VFDANYDPKLYDTLPCTGSLRHDRAGEDALDILGELAFDLNFSSLTVAGVRKTPITRQMSVWNEKSKRLSNRSLV